MKHLVVFALTSILFAGFAHRPSRLLETSYRGHSSILLDSFFQQWQREVPPLSQLEMSRLNDTLIQAYKVYEAFYRPDSLQLTGGSEFGDSLYKHVKYLIVQNSIKIKFTDKVFYTAKDSEDVGRIYIRERRKADTALQHKLVVSDDKIPSKTLKAFAIGYFSCDMNKTVTVDSIVDFRPPIAINGKGTVFLTATYDSLLNQFLGGSYIPLGASNLMAPAKAKNESKERQKFLERFVKIWYGHSGGYWQLLSYPKATSIVFDRNMQYAKVNYAMIYEGGEAILKRIDNNWVLVSAKRTWIE